MYVFNKPGFDMLERSLDAATLRQKVIADNVANIDTPYFKRSEVKFEELLQQELQGPAVQGYRTDPRHFEIGKPARPMPQVIQDNSTAINNNLNNVDIDYEMSLMAKNQLRYNVMVQQVNGELKKLRTVIDGRG
ncbi:flagellar basal body rod protein FlgB [Paenibacillus silviterrae]|uniref:flagellar basal body rod protein FlgB n=1 Tax=Paenibacillus silviterrae TaxID=3242194 RepID=UPI0025431EDD|nr:flagellar basal body rod protein FlgB [Paenibacillus chinjuensis]